MGNFCSQTQIESNSQLPQVPADKNKSIWGYNPLSPEYGIKGIFLSSLRSENDRFITQLFIEPDRDKRITVFFKITSTQPDEIFVSVENSKLSVIFMKNGFSLDEEDPISWDNGDFKIKDNNVVELKRKKSFPKPSGSGGLTTTSSDVVSLAVDQKNDDFQESMQQQSLFADSRENLPQRSATRQLEHDTVEFNDGCNLTQTLHSSTCAGGAVEDVELHQNFPQCGPSPSGTTHFPCVVTQFSGNTTTFSVSDDGRSITYINNDGVIQYVSLGVSKDTIKNINVYEICSGIYLIMIHATDGFVYVSGYSNRRTAKSLTSICVNNSFSENPKEFKIEFLPPKTADDGSELQNRDFKLLFSSSLSKTFNVNSNGVLNQIPNF